MSSRRTRKSPVRPKKTESNLVVETPLPSVRTPVEEKKEEEQEDEDCCICVEPLKSDSVWTLNCKHQLHTKCYMELTKRSMIIVCPLCRACSLKKEVLWKLSFAFLMECLVRGLFYGLVTSRNWLSLSHMSAIQFLAWYHYRGDLHHYSQRRFGSFWGPFCVCLITRVYCLFFYYFTGQTTEVYSVLVVSLLISELFLSIISTSVYMTYPDLTAANLEALILLMRQKYKYLPKLFALLAGLIWIFGIVFPWILTLVLCVGYHTLEPFQSWIAAWIPFELG